jgi:hypothetical protein
MEKELRYELQQNIPELLNSIYPTNAPEGATKPYLVYTRITTRIQKNLNGFTDHKGLSYMFSIMAVKYEDMILLRDKIEDTLKALPKTNIGQTNNIYVQDLEINNISEVFEFELGVNRGIIDFTIYQ